MDGTPEQTTLSGPPNLLALAGGGEGLAMRMPRMPPRGGGPAVWPEGDEPEERHLHTPRRGKLEWGGAAVGMRRVTQCTACGHDDFGDFWCWNCGGGGGTRTNSPERPFFWDANAERDSYFAGEGGGLVVRGRGRGKGGRGKREGY